MSKLLVLDFDGTMTDAEAEGTPYREGYLEDLASLTGAPLPEVAALAQRFEEQVAADPDSHGWLFHGQIVAPAAVDPYLRMIPVARAIFDHFGVFPGDADRTRLLDSVLYKYNYTKTRTAFRAGASAALLGLTGTHTHVVTNSHTEPVQQKIRELGGTGRPNPLDWLAQRVRGRAKKYVVDDTFEQVPATLRLPGLKRPVLLRRALYHEVLSELLAGVGADWSELVVVGDIFELDLALPLAMGARVGLVANPFTPAYEQAYLAEHPRGAVLTSLDQIAPFAALG